MSQDPPLSQSTVRPDQGGKTGRSELSLRLQAYRYDMKGLVLSPFGNASFAGVSRENTEEVKKP